MAIKTGITGTGLYELLEAAMVPEYLLLSYKEKNYFLGNMQQLQANLYTDIDRELSFKIHFTQKYDLASRCIPLGSLIIPSYPFSAASKLAFEVDFNAIVSVKSQEKEQGLGRLK